jgi:hypothetical protein
MRVTHSARSSPGWQGRLLASVLVGSVVGCGCPPEKPQPTRPEVVAGRKVRDEDGVRIVGEFVLRVGESTDNGVVGLAVASISPPRPCSHEGWYAYPNAKITLYRPADRTVVCENTWIPGSLVLEADCGHDLGFTGLSIAINSKEGWVHLRLLQ